MQIFAKMRATAANIVKTTASEEISEYDVDELSDSEAPTSSSSIGSDVCIR